MYLSLNNQLTTGRVPWPEFARLAAKVGFPGVDVMLGAAFKDGVENTRAVLEQAKVRPAIIDFPVEFRKDEQTFRDSLAKLADAAQFAAAIGCPRMMTWLMSSSDTPKAELRKTFKERFQRSADILARSHVRLGLEFLGPLHIRKQFKYEFIWKMPEMLEFAKECGSNVGLTLDAWHWHHAGATVQDILDAEGRIVEVHFDDSADLPAEKIRDNERLMPGEGVIDLVAFVRALKKIGYEDALSVEVFGRGLKDMAPEEGARLGFEKANAVMKKALG